MESSVDAYTNQRNLYFISAMFQTCFFSSFSNFNNEKLRYNYYNKQITSGEQ